MPLKLRVQLQGETPTHPFQHMAGLRKVVLDWVGAGGGVALATTVHDANQPNPYAISPLFGDGERRWFEVAVLADPFVPVFREGAPCGGTFLRLGPQRFEVQEVEAREEVSWEQLLQPSRRGLAMAVRLLTPTAHHASVPTRKAIVLPAPETYFGGWLGRWNLCCPWTFPESLLETVRLHVGIRACQGRTEAVSLDQGRRFIGFVGEVEFCVLQPELVAPEEKAALGALVRFASYCGTGVDTTRGMGQTRGMGERGHA